MELTLKTLSQLQIALKLDEYDYEKNTQGYFESMPTIGLADSQVIIVNDYLDILENKNSSKAEDFGELLERIRRENIEYQELLNDGSKSKLIKKYSRITGYLVRQMEKYNKLY